MKHCILDLTVRHSSFLKIFQTKLRMCSLIFQVLEILCKLKRCKILCIIYVLRHSTQLTKFHKHTNIVLFLTYFIPTKCRCISVMSMRGSMDWFLGEFSTFTEIVSRKQIGLFDFLHMHTFPSIFKLFLANLAYSKHINSYEKLGKYNFCW